MRKIIGTLAAAFLFLHSLPALAEKPGAMISESVTVTAKVEAVNKDTRDVTLVGGDGEKLTFKAGPEVRNFAQIQVGDKVTATSITTLAVYVTPQAEAPAASVTESLDRAALGEKPAGSYMRTVALTATVDALDLKTRMVTLRGPKGNKVTMKVGDHVKQLDKVKVGDTVAAEYTEVVDIAVTK